MPSAAPDPVGRIAEVAEKIQVYMARRQQSLRFSVDEELGRTVITVIDDETDKVIRQIPAEEVLALARHLRQEGALLDDTA